MQLSEVRTLDSKEGGSAWAESYVCATTHRLHDRKYARRRP